MKKIQEKCKEYTEDIQRIYEEVLKGNHKKYTRDIQNILWVFLKFCMQTNKKAS